MPTSRRGPVPRPVPPLDGPAPRPAATLPSASGVENLFNATIVDWGMLMAAGVMITVPAIAFFVAVQRYLT